jgi:hypothetical protein
MGEGDPAPGGTLRKNKLQDVADALDAEFSPDVEASRGSGRCF